MSKADQVEREDDRQRVLIQITQNVTARIKSTHAFKLPTFYLPYGADDPRQAPAIPNAIEEVCEEIDKAIKMTVQKNLSTLKTDSNQILQRIQDVRKEDVAAKRVNSQRRVNGFLLLLLSFLFLVLILLVIVRHIVAISGEASSILNSLIDKVPQAEFLRPVLGLPTPYFSDPTKFYYTVGTLAFLYLVSLIASKLVWRSIPVMTKKELEKLKLYEGHVKGLLKIRDGLYKEYFKQLQNQD
eukprot:TRINITY_DN3497_c1_g3_i1.p1 TRINITY_DN3497_c1_g3~~TRINITY_DN3497_c1_g3_i1.p1  ORF type:complete len:266 (-),score=61.69 TRINITY_DN3497_c1_g3_i1:89-811(-)